MIVWCSSTWLSTEPRAYLVSSSCAATSTASEIAMPSEPGWSSGKALPDWVSRLRRAVHLAAEDLDQGAALRLGVVGRADLPHLALDVEQRAA